VTYHRITPVDQIQLADQMRLAEGAGAKQDIGFVHIIVLHRRRRPVAQIGRQPLQPRQESLRPFTFQLRKVRPHQVREPFVTVEQTLVPLRQPGWPKVRHPGCQHCVDRDAPLKIGIFTQHPAPQLDQLGGAKRAVHQPKPGIGDQEPRMLCVDNHVRYQPMAGLSKHTKKRALIARASLADLQPPNG
jgi:hypothetical protein